VEIEVGLWLAVEVCIAAPRKNGGVGEAMNKPEFFVTPGYGERQLKMFHYSQAVKVGNRFETSGQGGWDDNWHFPEALADEITQAFQNVERTLAGAGADWEHVIAVNHVGF
jgi:enamine deaminase RidA (YjgF/YER057c/UK114 family)